MTRDKLLQETTVGIIDFDDEAKNSYARKLADYVAVNYTTDSKASTDTIRKHTEKYVSDKPVSVLLSGTLKQQAVEVIKDYLYKKYSEAFKNVPEPAAILGEINTDDLAEITAKAAEKCVYDGRMIDTSFGKTDILQTFMEYVFGYHNDLDVYEDENEDEDDEDEVRKEYVVKFRIAGHKDYTISGLQRRITNRLHYQWKGFGLCITLCKGASESDYNGEIHIFTDQETLQSITEKVFFRLGKTSGKTWRRFKVLSVCEAEE